MKDLATLPHTTHRNIIMLGESVSLYSPQDGVSEPGQSEHPQFGLRWKIFELDGCEGAGKVCLVFPPRSDGAQIDESGNIHVDLTPPDPQVWFLDRAFEWHYLACNFPTYFRMMLVHLGLPLWQMRFTSMGLPPGAQQLISKFQQKIFLRKSIFQFNINIRTAGSSSSPEQIRQR